MKKKQLDVKLCGYSYHTAPYGQTYRNGVESYIFRLQTEGSCTLIVNGDTLAAEPGDLLLLQPGDMYDLRVAMQEGQASDVQAPSGDYYVFCDGAWVDEWWRRANRPRLGRIIGDSRLLGIWNQLILEKRRLDGGSDELTSALLVSLCLLLDRALEEVKPSEDGRTSYLAVRMKHYIEEHALQPIKLEDVAAYADLSVSRTTHLFKAHYNIPILQYVMKIRLATAVELLRLSPMTLEQVAEAAGFGGYAYFHRVFKSRFGMSPGAYRQNHSLGRQ